MNETDTVQDFCPCGKESTVGMHVIKDGKVVDTYVCDDHRFKKPTKARKEKPCEV